jgi:hypothetical protein
LYEHCRSSRSLVRGGAAFPLERASPAYTPWAGDLSQVSHRVMAGLTMRAEGLTAHEAEGLGEQPMTIQEVMKKAVEGGYHLNGSDGMDTEEAGANRESSAWTSKEHDSTGVVGGKAPWLDPHFWRALVLRFINDVRVMLPLGGR